MLADSDREERRLWRRQAFLRLALTSFKFYGETKEERFREFGEWFKAEAHKLGSA